MQGPLLIRNSCDTGRIRVIRIGFDGLAPEVAFLLEN
jgi:hypothetical protein